MRQVRQQLPIVSRPRRLVRHPALQRHQGDHQPGIGGVEGEHRRIHREPGAHRQNADGKQPGPGNPGESDTRGHGPWWMESPFHVDHRSGLVDGQATVGVAVVREA